MHKRPHGGLLQHGALLHDGLHDVVDDALLLRERLLRGSENALRVRDLGDRVADGSACQHFLQRGAQFSLAALGPPWGPPANWVQHPDGGTARREKNVLYANAEEGGGGGTILLLVLAHVWPCGLSRGGLACSLRPLRKAFPADASFAPSRQEARKASRATPQRSRDRGRLTHRRWRWCLPTPCATRAG
jgi:hypothetical protein